VEGPFGHVEDFIDPETLRSYETIDDDGDSILADDDNECCEDDRAAQENSLEKELSIMATQTLELGDEENSVGPTTASQLRQGNHHSFEGEEILSSEDGETSSMASDEVLTDPVIFPKEDQRLSVQRKTAENKAVKYPPVRGQVVDLALSTRLLPIPPKKGTPDWMKHLSTYNTHRKKWASSAASSHAWFPEDRKSGGLVSLTRCPPSRKSVMAWYWKQSKKRTKEDQSDVQVFPQKKARTMSGKDELVAASLAVDGNSPKLVAAVNTTARNDDSDDKLRGKQIEEVDWCSSQNMSQAEARTPAVKTTLETPGRSICSSVEKHQGLSYTIQEFGHDELS
jgi:hypothetical protein